MIFDILANAHRYLDLHEGFAQAFTFLRRADLHELPEDTYEIDGDRVYAMVAKEAGRRRDEALLESHKKYIDIQLVLAGRDEMGWKTTSLCTQPAAAYDPATDLQFFADRPDAWLPTPSGFFVIFFPEDAHMPLISTGPIHKVVVKIAVIDGDR